MQHFAFQVYKRHVHAGDSFLKSCSWLFSARISPTTGEIHLCSPLEAVKPSLKVSYTLSRISRLPIRWWVRSPAGRHIVADACLMPYDVFFPRIVLAPIQNTRRFSGRHFDAAVLARYLRDFPLFRPADARPTDEETGSVRHKRSQGADRFSLATTGRISGVRPVPNRRKRVHLRPIRLTGPPRSPG
jgi:hypothetical protein